MKKLIAMMLEKKAFAYVLILSLTLGGIVAYSKLKIDVFPDPSPVLVQILTEGDGMAPEEVEKFISYPIETSLYGLPGVKKITSLSAFGFSTVNVYFDDSVDTYFARQLVSQQLPGIKSKLPDFVEPPELGPITTGLGMVYIYAFEGDFSPMEVRTLQDWVVKFQMQTTPGIAAVLSHGGSVKQFHVKIDPAKMLKYRLDVHQIMEKIGSSSNNVTAGYLIKNREEYIIRGLGLTRDLDDLNNIAIKTEGSTPVYLKNVATIGIGEEIKRGEALLDERGSVVSGIIMKLIGVNTADLIEKIDENITNINKGLPKGLKIIPVYNQGLIIKAAFYTVAEALIIGIILVALILLIFLNDLGSSLVSTLSIPFAVFTTFIVMYFLDMSADLMSFGGLAIGIGLLVDATIVVVENISRNRSENRDKELKSLIMDSITQVLRPLTYAMLMILLSFIPILTLQGVEGKMFKPFGIALLIAITSAIIYALFFAPVLMGSFKNRKEKKESRIFEKISNSYMRIFDIFYKKQNLTLLLFTAVFIFSAVIFITSGSEFIPRLNEQTIQLEVMLPQNASLKETTEVIDRIQKLVTPFPEVERMYGRIGRGEGGTHPHPVNEGNIIITLTERDKWQVDTQNQLIEKIDRKVIDSIPGILLNYSQPIKHNLDHLLTGVRADLAIKIYGDDYPTLLKLANETKASIQNIEGVQDIQVSRVTGLNEVRVTLDRKKLARYNLSVEEVLEDLEIRMGGKTAGKVFQGDISFDVFVRYDEKFRKTSKDLNNLILNSPKGELIPLSSVAEIREETGLSNVSRENGKRYITVQCNVRDRDIGSVVEETKNSVYSAIKFPLGYFASWGGQFELKQSAEKRLYLVLAITFFLILILLFDFLKSWKDISVILITLPVSLSGGVISLWLAGAYLSIPATIGFLALFGIALENTLILITFFRNRTLGSEDFDAAVKECVRLRLRPVLMTKFTTIIGLFPLLFATGIGSEIQKPLVIVVIGGIIFSIFTTLLLMPITFRKLYKK